MRAVFVQAMQYTTSKPDEVKEVLVGWERATEGKRGARRIVSTRHHDDPSRHVDLVFFDSYDSAMANSQLPETDEYAQRLRELVDGELVFFDLDVVEDRRLS
jgi:archaellum biogenesis ATPase FlaH